jgi:hypothetical protein
MVIDFLKGRSYSFHCIFFYFKNNTLHRQVNDREDDENFKGFVSNHWYESMWMIIVLGLLIILCEGREYPLSWASKCVLTILNWVIKFISVRVWQHLSNFFNQYYKASGESMFCGWVPIPEMRFAISGGSCTFSGIAPPNPGIPPCCRNI